MTFRAIATTAEVIAFILGIGYLFAGHLVVGRWQVDPTEGVLLMGRRMGAVYLGLSAIFFAARSTEESPARSAIARGAAVALFLLALVGVYEFAVGNAARGILVSAAVELLLAVGFVRVLMTERRVVVAA
ncbi:MAG: hypothetical protein JWP22_3211 [Ramlibacter sp.]|nr:hypothetical protein [Ramlibacter sp.]